MEIPIAILLKFDEFKYWQRHCSLEILEEITFICRWNWNIHFFIRTAFVRRIKLKFGSKMFAIYIDTWAEHYKVKQLGNLRTHFKPILEKGKGWQTGKNILKNSRPTLNRSVLLKKNVLICIPNRMKSLSWAQQY